MALINTFPDGVARGNMRELCRFTKSGTFNPVDYPTADGLYDVYIVGGGGGGFHFVPFRDYAPDSGGGGGYAKLLKRLAISGSVAVTIGGAGVGGRNNTMTSGSGNAVTATDGGVTRFGSYGSANGGKGTNTEYRGGDGGCGGAGLGGSFGGVDGQNGTAGEILTSGVNVNKTSSGTGGTGGGNVDYCPTNPYDDRQYGIGGNATYGVMGYDGAQSRLYFPPLNNNPGRGGSGLSTYPALPGVCIIYGIPLE